MVLVLRAGKKARGSRAGSGSERLGSARSGSRAWNEPSRASFLGSLKYRAEPSQLALARELSHLWTTCQLSCNLKCFLFILSCSGYGTVKILIWYC